MYGKLKHQKIERWPITAAAIVLQACFAVVISGNLVAQPPSNGTASTSNQQILVLKNGQILSGRIDQDHAKLIVHTQQGSRIVISKSKADFICDSIAEAFWGKSARTRASDTQAQIELFRWCLKHRQLDLAESQLGILMQSDVSAAQLVSLNRQLGSMIDSQLLRAKEKLRIAFATDQDDQRNAVPQLQPPRLPSTPRNAKQLPPPLPNTERQKFVATEKSNRAEPVISTDGKVVLASFDTPISPRKSEAVPNAAQPTLKPIRPSFSTAGAIPDLSTNRRLTPPVRTEIDPYNASDFNAETARRRSERK